MLIHKMSAGEIIVKLDASCVHFPLLDAHGALVQMMMMMMVMF